MKLNFTTRMLKGTICLLALVALATPSAKAQALKVLHSSTASEGQVPADGHLLRDTSGNLYGASYNPSIETVYAFELINSSGTYSGKILSAFANITNSSGVKPNLVIDGSGNLYGISTNGGAHNSGTVFELVNSSGTYSENLLYNFASFPTDGYFPSALIMDEFGNLYGTTTDGGTYGYGTVFELVNSSGTYSGKLLHSFSAPNGCGGDGASPTAGLVLDPSGNIYGATQSGGANGYGIVFEIAPFSGVAYETATTLTSSPNPVTVSDGVGFAAAVASSSGFLPTGNISFSSGATPLGTSPLVCGNATLGVEDLDSLGIGAHAVTAQYIPDVPAFAPSSKSLIQTVNLAGVAVTGGSNTFTGNQMINGTVNATSITGNGANLTSISPSNISSGTAGINITGNAATATTAGIAADATELGGVIASRYARLDVGNNLTGSQTIAGDMSVTGNSSATGTLTIGNGGTAITEHLSMTINPTFSAPKPGNTCSSASFPFPRASDGDTIALGVPNSRIEGSLAYTAWVNAADAITIRACAFPSDQALLKRGFGSGAIRVDLWKH